MIQQGNLFKVDFNWTIFIQIRVIKTWYNDSKTAHTLTTDWFIFLVQIRVKKNVCLFKHSKTDWSILKWTY